jgi:hypothetical protein
MISRSKENNLILDYSQTLDYSCLIIVTPWKKGITWTSIIEGETTPHTHFLDDPGLPFSLIYNTSKTCPWINEIPEPLVETLLDYEKTYQVSIYPLLYLLSHYQSAIDLFTSNPVLITLIIHCAQKHKWTEAYVIDLLLEKRTHILAACGLRGQKSTLKTLNKLSLGAFSHQTYRVIQEILALPNSHKLNHLRYIDIKLFWLLSQYPELVSSRLLQSYQEDWSIKKFKQLYADTLRMAVQINRQTLINCRTLDELEKIHDRYIVQTNRRKKIINVDYPAPPITGCEYIIPITNSNELFEEGLIQRHCVASYHRDVFEGKSYIYKILAPERATLEVRIQTNGDYWVSQLKLSGNRDPSEESIETIYQWMNEGKQMKQQVNG